MKAGGHNRFENVAKDNAAFREAAGLKGTLEHTAEAWAARENESFRRAHCGRVLHYFPDGFLQELPPPLFVGQELYWVEWLNGAKHREMILLAVNTPFGLGWRYQSESKRNYNWTYEG